MFIVRRRLTKFSGAYKKCLMMMMMMMMMTKALVNKTEVFINRSLRRILGIRWSDRMRNEDLRKATEQELAEILLKRMAAYLGYSLRNLSPDKTDWWLISATVCG